MCRTILVAVSLVLCALSPLRAQEQKPQEDMPGMSSPAPALAPSASPDAPKPQAEMPEMKMPDAQVTTDTDMRVISGANADGAAHAMRSMQDRQMNMGPHMKMTTLRDLKPGDREKADAVIAGARKAAEQYTDYKVALADGFKIFLPNLPQKQYHFTNYRYAFEAAISFNPEHPSSLLYEKHGNDYKLIGVMYTAPKRFTEDQLDERIPLSVAQWHEHVNFCAPPADRRKETLAPHPQFGLRGSITAQPACEAAGGTFHPVIFNWMVHVYPFEKDQAKMWSVERQHGDAD